ncbi:MAG: hypothetical protein AAB583_05350 [Patescibacteria group bacterium]
MKKEVGEPSGRSDSDNFHKWPFKVVWWHMLSGGIIVAVGLLLSLPLSYIFTAAGLIRDLRLDEILPVYILILFPTVIFSFFLGLALLIRVWLLFGYRFEEEGIRITTGFFKRHEYFIPYADIKRTYMYSDLTTDILGLRIIFLDLPNYFYINLNLGSYSFLTSWWYMDFLIGPIFHRKWWLLRSTACVWYSEKEKADALLNFLNSKIIK